MDTIIAGADGSPDSTRAVEWAAREALIRRSPLRIVHAVAPWAHERNVDPRLRSVHEWLLAAGQDVVEAAVETARRRVEGLDVGGAVVAGGAARALLECARDASMIVIGGRGAATVAGLLLGSTALQVVSHTPVPAVVVRSVEPVARQEIVVGLDAPSTGDPALSFAVEEARLRGVRLRVVHVWSDPATADSGGAVGLTPPAYDRDPIAAGHTHRLHDVLAPWREKHPELEVVPEAVYGRPVRILSGLSARSDLLVVGTRGRGGFTGLVLGSVSHGLLHQAQCPLAVVPSAA